MKTNPLEIYIHKKHHKILIVDRQPVHLKRSVLIQCNVRQCWRVYRHRPSPPPLSAIVGICLMVVRFPNCHEWVGEPD